MEHSQKIKVVFVRHGDFVDARYLSMDTQEAVEWVSKIRGVNGENFSSLFLGVSSNYWHFLKEYGSSS